PQLHTLPLHDALPICAAREPQSHAESIEHQTALSSEDRPAQPNRAGPRWSGVAPHPHEAGVPAERQGRPALAFRGDAGFVWVRSDTAPAGAGAIRLRGPVLGGEGRLVFNGFSVGLGLSSGTDRKSVV